MKNEKLLKKQNHRLKFVVFLFLSIVFLNNISFADFDKKEEDSFYVAVKSYEDGFYDISLTLFDRYLKTYVESGKKIEALIYIGQCYFFKEKYLKALDQFNMLLSINGAGLFKDKILFWLGEIYVKGKDYKQAAEFYKELIKDYPDSSYLLSAFKSLARAQEEGGSFEEALSTYRQVLSKFNDSSIAQEVLLNICGIYYKIRDYTQLKKELDIFISQYSKSEFLGRIYFYLGEANFYLGQYNDAIGAYDKACKAVKDNELNMLAQLGEGWAYLKLKDYDSAKGIFSGFGDDNQPLAVILGKAVLEGGLENFEKSLELFEKVINSDKNEEYLPLAYFGKAEAAYNLSKFEDAIIAYRVSMDKLKTAPVGYSESRELRDKVRYGLAWAYLKTGDFKSAQEEFQKIVSFSSDKIFKISALCQLGDTYQDLGDYKKAVESYQDFLNNYPDSAYNDYVQYQLGMSWLKMESLDSAIMAFRKLLKDYPDSKLADDANYFIGVSYFQKSDYSASRQQLEKFKDGFKDSSYRPQAVFLLGEVLVNLTEFKEALGVFQIVIKEFYSDEPLRQKAEYEIADVYSRMGNETEAGKKFTDFISRYPDSRLSADIVYWLAQSYFEKKDFLFSRKYLERFIRNYPDHDFIADAFLQMGLTYFEEKNYDIALRNFNMAKDNCKGAVCVKACLLCGDAYVNKEDFANALKSYQEAASFENSDLQKSAYVKMAFVYRSDKSFKEAVLALDKALKVKGPGVDSEIQFNMAEVLEEMGSYEDALEAYLKVYYLYPEDKIWAVKALLRVSRIYEDKEDWKEFKSILNNILKYDAPEVKYAEEKLTWLKENGLDK